MNKRHLHRMLQSIADARSSRISLVESANNLLFLRSAIDDLDRHWADEFTSNVATLESAGTASLEQRREMGAKYEKLVSETLDALENLVKSLVGSIQNDKDE